jgi:hypothetical protein
MGRPIFISYRRDDTEGEAGRLYDDLSRTFGEGCVFMDVVGISPGVDFRNVIEENVSQCGVLLAMIGPSWATISGDDGKRRLENPNDFVRIEIATALARDIAVIPVLVHGARMPHPEQLPENLQNLAFRNSVEITHTRWSSDVQLLMQALQSYVTAPQQGRNRPVHAELPVQLPPPYPRGPQAAPPEAKSRTPLYAVLGVLLAALIGAGAYFGIKASHHAPATPTPAQTDASTQTAASTQTPTSAGTASPAQTTASSQTAMPSQTAAPAPAAVPGSAAPHAPSNLSNRASSSPDTSASAGANNPQPAAVSAHDPLLGTWSRSGRSINAPVRFQIYRNNGQLYVHAWGDCQKSPCDWGVRPLRQDGDTAKATWTFQSRLDGKPTQISKVDIKPVVPPGFFGLHAVTHNSFEGSDVRGLWKLDYSRSAP